MKIKKFVAGLSAAVLAATMMSAFIWVRTGPGIRGTG